MRIRFWSAVLAVVSAMLPGQAVAQPKITEPTVEVRLRSVNDLVDKAEYVGGLVDKDEPIKQVRELIKNLSAEGKGVEGLDPKRPFGAYAILTPDVASSPVVVMVPVADEKRLLAALKERLSIEPEKAEDGTLKLHVPLINEVYLRFANEYVYAARDPKHLDSKGLVAPKTFFAKDDGSVASITVRFDRIPDDLKTFVIGQFEHQVQEQLKKDNANKPEAERKLAAIFSDGIVGSVKSIAEEGKELSVRVFVDSKTDELSADVVLTAKDGSTLAKNIAGMAAKSSLPAGIATAKNIVFQSTGKLELTDEMKKRLNPEIDNLIEEAVKQAKPNDREAARRVLTALAPTFKAAEVDYAVSLIGPNANGKHTLLAAVAVKDGKELEKLLKEFASSIPADAVDFTFDTETIGEFKLHKVDLKAVNDEDFERVFGTKAAWLAVSDDCIAFSIEPDGTALRAGLKAKAVGVRVASAEVSLVKILPLAGKKKLKTDEVKALVKDAFGAESPVGKDTIVFSVEGGTQLTAKIKVKGKAFRLAAMLDEFKNK